MQSADTFYLLDINSDRVKAITKLRVMKKINHKNFNK